MVTNVFLKSHDFIQIDTIKTTGLGGKLGLGHNPQTFSQGHIRQQR